MFYENYVKLCNSIGKKPSKVAEEISISKSLVSRWKSGTGGASDATLQKIADYFGITISELKGETDEKKLTAESGELDEIDKQIMAAVVEIEDKEEKIRILKIIHSLQDM